MAQGVSTAGRAAVLAALLLALALPGAAAAGPVSGTDTIVAADQFGYSGGTGAGGAFRLDAGQRPMFRNDDAVAMHNVVAFTDGPDGDPLFLTALIGSGATAAVDGAQYLQPGSYSFYCTIHSGMNGSLEVSGPGAMPRPAVALAVDARKVRQLRKGRLKVEVEAVTDSSDVSVSARVGGKAAGHARGIDLEAGAGETLKLKLPRSARKAVARALRKDRRLTVELAAEVPWGSPVAARKKLR